MRPVPRAAAQATTTFPLPIEKKRADSLELSTGFGQRSGRPVQRLAIMTSPSQLIDERMAVRLATPDSVSGFVVPCFRDGLPVEIRQPRFYVTLGNHVNHGLGRRARRHRGVGFLALGPQLAMALGNGVVVGIDDSHQYGSRPACTRAIRPKVIGVLGADMLLAAAAATVTGVGHDMKLSSELPHPKAPHETMNEHFLELVFA